MKSFIESLFKKEKRKLGSINYIFCTDKRLLEINQQFLQHDFYTDVISFDLSESNTIIAEVYISIDRVKENAMNLGSPFKRELYRVIFHGALHLCGFEDKTAKQVKQIREKEGFYISRLP